MADACTAGVDTGFVSLGYAKVAFLGVVQGLTELMPISSTAHMRIVPAVLGWRDPGSAFSAAMQLAALGAVIAYFWRDIVGIGAQAILAIGRRDMKDKSLQFVFGVIVATIPIVIAGALLSKTLNTCGSPLRAIWVIGLSCLIMALLLAAAELAARHVRDLEQVGWADHIIVGLAQVGALIPGVSRSGSTLTAAMFLGLRREDAARFSFLLGLPAIMLAGLHEMYELHKAGLDGHGWAVLAVGLVVASISAYVAIWTLIAIVERFSTWPFVAYRAVLGVVLIGGAVLGLLS